MKFDPNFILTGLDGKPLEGNIESIHLGKIIAQALFYHNEGPNRLKFHTWALKLYNQEPIELDDQDKELLERFIKDSKFPGITYAPLIKLLE